MYLADRHRCGVVGLCARDQCHSLASERLDYMWEQASDCCRRVLANGCMMHVLHMHLMQACMHVRTRARNSHNSHSPPPIRHPLLSQQQQQQQPLAAAADRGPMLRAHCWWGTCALFKRLRQTRKAGRVRGGAWGSGWFESVPVGWLGDGETTGGTRERGEDWQNA